MGCYVSRDSVPGTYSSYNSNFNTTALYIFNVLFSILIRSLMYCTTVVSLLSRGLLFSSLFALFLFPQISSWSSSSPFTRTRYIIYLSRLLGFSFLDFRQDFVQLFFQDANRSVFVDNLVQTEQTDAEGEVTGGLVDHKRHARGDLHPFTLEDVKHVRFRGVRDDHTGRLETRRGDGFQAFRFHHLSRAHA